MIRNPWRGIQLALAVGCFFLNPGRPSAVAASHPKVPVFQINKVTNGIWLSEALRLEPGLVLLPIAKSAHFAGSYTGNYYDKDEDLMVWSLNGVVLFIDGAVLDANDSRFRVLRAGDSLELLNAYRKHAVLTHWEQHKASTLFVCGSQKVRISHDGAVIERFRVQPYSNPSANP